MARFARKSKAAPKEQDTTVEDSTPPQPKGLTEEIDHLLDLVDEVLEVNAEAFVKAYVQRGGQ